jgi:competence ComEA-like helix-hairpin-helix protein
LPSQDKINAAMHGKVRHSAGMTVKLVKPGSPKRPTNAQVFGRSRVNRTQRPLAVLAVLSLAMLAFAIRLSAQQKTGTPDSTNQWEVLTGCLLRTNALVDGDSFHVTHKGREYVFRLYFVDAPETESSLRERIEDQAAYFGISTNDILRAGRLAAKFTRDKLSGHEITVITRWQNALGRGTLARFYGVVFVGGQNLAEELVVNGLARIHGLRANWPDGPRSTTFISQLKNKELVAREQKRGIWDDKPFPRGRAATGMSSLGTNETAKARKPSPTKVELNSASFEELQTLPGIGPKLAERIVAHRPYKTVADLDRVPAIGAKTIERLRPLVQVEKRGP